MRQSELGRQREVEHLQGYISVVLRGLFNLHLVEVTRVLQLSNEISNRVDGASHAHQGQPLALALQGSEPQGIGAGDGIGQGIQKLLSAGAVSLHCSMTLMRC